VIELDRSGATPTFAVSTEQATLGPFSTFPEAFRALWEEASNRGNSAAATGLITMKKAVRNSTELFESVLDYEESCSLARDIGLLRENGPMNPFEPGDAAAAEKRIRWEFMVSFMRDELGLVLLAHDGGFAFAFLGSGT